MGISVTGSSPREVARILTLLQDYNAYTLDSWPYASFASKQLAEAIEFFSDAKEMPYFEVPEGAGELVQEGDEKTVFASFKSNGFDYNYTAGLAAIVDEPLKDPVLCELLYDAGGAFNPKDEEVFTAIDTAYNDPRIKQTSSMRIIKDREEAYQERKENGLLYDEKQGFYSFLDARTSQAHRLDPV